MTPLETIGSELQNISTEMSRLEARLAENDAARFIADAPIGSCVIYLDGCGTWCLSDTLPEGYVGRYYEAGRPFSPKLAQSEEEKMMARSIMADHANGWTLD